MRTAAVLLTLTLLLPLVDPAVAGESRVVSGRVVDEEGRPIEGAALVSPKTCHAVTDATGRFSFVAPGQWDRLSFHVRHNDFVAKEHAVAIPSSGVEIVLSRGLSIRGRVQFPDGVPVADARVLAYRHPGQLGHPGLGYPRSDVRAGADGSFQFTGFRPEERFLLTSLFSEMEATAGDGDVTIELPCPVIRLSLLDEAGQPLPEPHLVGTLYRGEERLFQGIGDRASARDWLLPIIDGDRILVSPVCPGWEMPVADFRIEGSPRLILKTITVSRLTRPSRLSIHVQDADGRPARAVYLGLKNQAGAEPPGVPRFRFKLDELGCGVIDGLPPGDYRMGVASADSRKNSLLSARCEITLRPGQTTGESFILPLGGHLRIRIKGSSAPGFEADRWKLVLLDPKGNSRFFRYPFPDPGVCDGLGHPLPPGTWRVRLLRDDEIVVEHTVRVKVGEVAGVTVVVPADSD